MDEMCLRQKEVTHVISMLLLGYHRSGLRLYRTKALNNFQYKLSSSGGIPGEKCSDLMYDICLDTFPV
jgi:hypothetical protein